jgi:hypothetical protein
MNELHNYNQLIDLTQGVIAAIVMFSSEKKSTNLQQQNDNH